MTRLRIAEQAAQTLQAMVAERGLQAGDRLPAERQLAAQLGISRGSLREAIRLLDSRGLLRSHPGGGTYVAQPVDEGGAAAGPAADPMLALFRQNPEYRFDVLEVRHALEGSAAFYAALRSTDEDRARIVEAHRAMVATPGHEDPVKAAQADAAFHLAIVEASHNLVLLHVMENLFALLSTSISHNLGQLYALPRVQGPLATQHQGLLTAILDGQPEQARRAAQEHLTFVEEALKRMDEEEARKLRSMRRLTV